MSQHAAAEDAGADAMSPGWKSVSCRYLHPPPAPVRLVALLPLLLLLLLPPPLAAAVLLCVAMRRVSALATSPM